MHSVQDVDVCACQLSIASACPGIGLNIYYKHLNAPCGLRWSSLHAKSVNSAGVGRWQMPFETNEEDIACGVLGSDSDVEEVDLAAR